MSEGARHVDSWYLRTANPFTDDPPLAGETRADVAVLGAGFTGLTAALHLALRGFKVTVLEARRVGWGASGRNGGQILTGYNPSIATIGTWVGPEDARRLWHLSQEAKRLLTDTISRHGIACGLTRGYLFAGLKPRHMAALRDMQAEWRGLGHDGTQLLDQAQMRERVGSPRYVGGLYDPEGGHLHPLNYALGLAEACRAAGVTIHEQSPVVAVDTGAAPSLTTAGGRVRAKALVIAGNALLGKLVPGLGHTIAPVGTYIAATERLGRARMRQVLRDDVAVCDMNFVLNYYRRTPDDRLLFGARVSYSGREPPNLKHLMRRSMLHVFPQLADIRFDQVWGGLVDITVNRAPHLGRIGPASYFAHGFSGQGVALTGIAGHVIAEAIAGQAERFDLFARIPHATFPGGPLRTPALMLAMLWYRLRDMI
ncbi:MAG: FAD-dependent oxidoreductase [Rhodospirillales bacterium]|nr:FAD-dependent oxidoreductase [Rhodospirillales bacterium]